MPASAASSEQAAASLPDWQALVPVSSVQRRLVWSVALDGESAALLWQQEIADGEDVADAWLELQLARAESETLRHAADAAAEGAAQANAETARVSAQLTAEQLAVALLQDAAREADAELARERAAAEELRAQLSSEQACVRAGRGMPAHSRDASQRRAEGHRARFLMRRRGHLAHSLPIPAGAAR